MKILITGGAGFVGSHLADKLIGEGNEITVIDDLSTGRYSNVAHLEDREGFRLLIDTVLNERLMEELIRETDHVYHMASAVGVKLIMERPVRTIETIFRGTDVVLGFCSRYRKRVLIPSTSEVYGKGASVPFKEDDDLLTGATDKPEVEVSWQVTGVRKDKFAEDNRIKVEEDKLPADRGKCLHPSLCSGAKLDPGQDARKENKARELKP